MYWRVHFTLGQVDIPFSLLSTVRNATTQYANLFGSSTAGKSKRSACEQEDITMGDVVQLDVWSTGDRQWTREQEGIKDASRMLGYLNEGSLGLAPKISLAPRLS